MNTRSTARSGDARRHTARRAIRPRRVRLAAAALSAAALAIVVTIGAEAADLSELSPYDRLLGSQVDGPKGAPLPGQDPASQPQTSLNEAARTRKGIGTRGGKPARDVKPGKLQRDPRDVIPDPRITARLANGCMLGYGTPGAQCVPARAAGNKPLTCAYLLRLFPAGVRVTGRDVLRLDTNGDGWACRRGDRDVPAAAHAHG